MEDNNKTMKRINARFLSTKNKWNIPYTVRMEGVIITNLHKTNMNLSS